jgi:hypothetical protein
MIISQLNTKHYNISIRSRHLKIMRKLQIICLIKIRCGLLKDCLTGELGNASIRNLLKCLDPPYPCGCQVPYRLSGIALSPEHLFFIFPKKMHPNFFGLFLVFEERVV